MGQKTCPKQTLFRRQSFNLFTCYEKELKKFVESSEIELSQSACERALKLGICEKKSFMFIDSVDGANSFANYQTVINTCNLNNVPVQHYLLWLVANIKYRMHKMQNEGHDDSTFFYAPSKQKLKHISIDDNGDIETTELIFLYDKRNAGRTHEL